MAQKTKVKELVGRGLDSYHTKSLQQIDRIEKKNKEQNHKISILSNELDNDYLTKTEEGSVVSLEHSKEGMVYLDELQGNTLVNYCTDGSKEMTLNGDIDVEGTFVTTTEGVDGGKVDVVCEGNTLVALASTPRMGNTITLLHPLTTGKEYTLLFTTTKQPTSSQRSCFMVWKDNQLMQYLEPVENAYYTKLGSYRIKFTAQDTHTYLGCWTQNVVGELEYSNVMLLEGDWTSRELPSYFEGMKSVGQDDTNGHKIEILSQNKNLLTSDKFEKWGNEINIEYSGDVEKFVECSKTSIEVEPNTTYTFSALMKATSNLKSAEIYLYEYKKGETKYFKATPKYVVTDNILEFTRVSYTFTTSKETDKILLRFDNNGSSDGNVAILTCKEYCLSLGNNTAYVEPMFNKKEILLNEPLRGLPEGIKDRKVRIGKKWYIERNCGEMVLNGTEPWVIYSGDNEINEYPVFYYSNPNIALNHLMICNKIPVVKTIGGNTGKFAIGSHSSVKGIRICIELSKLSSRSVDALKEWLQNNNVTITYKLETPIYEPLEIEPTLTTYNDITHISNNSIIPCNMKIQNSGYNAIIKPSTLYTVALDTDKSGTIGMNLGGAKGTTTNNVLTLTTPATLADDSLRLYGKGIKGSKVRLLEGDKTNWIPNHFEGMKSSFEDKVQSDGTYKMEILSNNENLFDKHKYSTNENWYNTGWNHFKVEFENEVFKFKMRDGWQNYYFDFPFILNQQYTLKFKARLESETASSGQIKISKYYTTDRYNSVELTKSVLPNGDWKEYTFHFIPNYKQIGFNCFISPEGKGHEGIWFVKDIQISKSNTSFIECKSNKIQFSSIEPLRSLPNGVKDKFIFKDNKLMIERNTRKSKVNNIENVSRSYDRWNNIVFAYKVEGLISVGESIKNVWSNLLPSRSIADLCNTLGKTGIASHNWVDRKLQIAIKGIDTVEKMKEWISKNNLEIVYQIEPTYEEISFELQKVILEGYENGTLFFDTNIPPTSTVTYAGETPIVKATKLNKTEVLNNTNDINDNIIPYLIDMDYRVVCLQLETNVEGISMARLFGGAYEMLKRDIQSNRLSKEEYGYRLIDYFNAGKLTEEEVRELEDLK